MTDISRENGYAISLDIPDAIDPRTIPFVQALVTIEDKRFFSHWGIDSVAKLRALWDNIRYWWTISGASTLTEQWVKNTYFIGKKRGILQKIREALLAGYFSLTTDKDIILKKYLDSVYFWNHIYGLQAASENFFQKNDIQNLNEEEITLLITLLHNPSKDPDDPDFKKYFERVKERLGYTFTAHTVHLSQRENQNRFPFISQKALQLCAIHEKDIPKGPILFSQYDCKKGEFTSTIDASLSLFARETLGNNLESLTEKHVTNGAIFAMQPLTKEVIIYEGSRDFYSSIIDGQVDIIHAPRQPGSSMKPFLYLMALERGFNPDDIIIDTVQEYPSFQPWTTYTSENYTLKEYGLVRMKKALGNSFNNASVRLAKSLGLTDVYNFYKTYGFKFDFPAEYYGYSLVLGNPSITLWDLVLSYTQLVPQPNKEGDVNAMSFLLYDILRDPDNRDVSFGTNSILNTSILQAVKTGTSSNFRDNTLISYSPDMVMGLWVWNNDNTPMIWVTGITGAGYVWHQIIEEAIRRGYISDRELKIPPALEVAPYCLDIQCYRKESVYQKKEMKYFSSILDGIYDHRDIRETITNEDKTRLEELGFRIK